MAASGACVSDQQPACPYAQTRSGTFIPTHPLGQTTAYFKTSREVFLQNGDKCVLGQFVIVKDLGALGTTLTARVEEILHVQNSVADLSGMPNCILLRAVNLDTRTSDMYHMPCIELKDQWGLFELKVRRLLI